MTSQGGLSEWFVLSRYALLGAVLAAGLLFVATRTGVVALPEPTSAAAGTADAACALRMTSEPCDRCMDQECRESCESCASSPWCLKLYACVLDCREEECSRACARRFAEGRAALDAFAGDKGCMATRCREQCR